MPEEQAGISIETCLLLFSKKKLRVLDRWGKLPGTEELQRLVSVKIPIFVPARSECLLYGDCAYDEG